MTKPVILIDLPEQIETSCLLPQMPKAEFGPRLHETSLEEYEEIEAV